MRLFRKQKAAQASASVEASQEEEMLCQPPPATAPVSAPSPLPPLALKLDLELLPIQPDGFNLGGSTLEAPNCNSSVAQQQPECYTSGVALAQGLGGMPAVGSNVRDPHGQLGSMSADVQRIAAAYSFDYPYQLAEEPTQNPAEENSIEKQLAEQFGMAPRSHYNMFQPQTQTQIPPPTQSTTSYDQSTPRHASYALGDHHMVSRSSPSLHQPQQQHHQQLARMVMQNLHMATTNRTTINRAPLNQVPMSRSSHGGSSASSEDEGGVPKLSSSMAAMSLPGGTGHATGIVGGQMSDRAMHIQRVREASAMGKVVAYAKSAAVPPAGTSDDDEDDMVPLGGLKRPLGNGSFPDVAPADNNGVQASMAPQHDVAHGNVHQGSLAQDGGQGAGRPYAPQHAQSMLSLNQQQLYHYQQQQQQAMYSPSASSVASHASAPVVSKRAAMYQPGFVNGVTAHGIHASGLPVQQAPPGHHQMMPYPRNAMAAGGIGAVYGNAGFPRPLGMPDPATHVHTPSPLGQVPIYGHPSLAGQLQQVPQADPRVTQYPPAMANQAAMNMGYLQAYAQRTQQYQPPPPQQHQMPPPPQQQLPPQQAMTGQHQAALASFIPSQMACRGSLAKNPLMRDINKLKDFSAKDYSARPTLLAEADTRRLAMKSIPGLGGSTCHSYQPEEPPSTQQQHTQQQHTQQQHTQHQQQPRSSGARDYHDIDDHYARPNRYEASYHRSQSCHNLEDEDNDGSSTSSYIGNRHHQGSRGGGGGRVPKRQHHHERGNNAYRSEYSERASVREHRQMPSPRSSHGRRALDRRHHPRRDNQYYEYYDYDEYSESYASDYDNEWDEERESNPRHGRHYEGRIADMDLSGRRAAHRRPRADVYTTRGRDNTAWESQHRAGRHAPPGHGGYHRRPRLARLDDPRDGDSIVIRSTHPPMSKAAGSSDSESLLVLEHGKPRSQFGRILANLKRHASEAKATSPLLTTQDAQHYDGKDEAEDPESGNRIVEVVSETEENQAGNVEGGLAKPEVATNTSEKSPLATASTNSGSEPDAANLPPPPSNLSASAEADKEEAHDNEHLAPPTPAVAAVAVTIAAT